MGIDRSRARRPTQHARAEGAAQAIEGQYRALLEAIPDLIFHLDGEGRFLDFVLAKGQEPALRPAEFLGRTVREVMPTDLARRMMHHIDRALQTGEAQVFEYRIPVPLPDGNPRDYEARIAASAKDGVVAIVRDITRSGRTRDALRESEAKYRQVFEHVHDVFYRADTNGAFTEISPSVEWWGHDVEQLIGAQVSDVYEDPQGRSAFLSLLLEQGRVIDYEVRLKTGDGRLIDASVSSHLLRDRDGVVVGIEGIARDITERKRAERALRESEERLRSLVTNAPVVLFAIDREGVFTVEEGRGLSRLGLRPGQNVGRSVFDVYRDVPEVIDAVRRALAGESFTATVGTGRVDL
jgi:PAS domain S-box-containing protein